MPFNIYVGGSGRDILFAAQRSGVPLDTLRGVLVDLETPALALPQGVAHLNPRPDKVWPPTLADPRIGLPTPASLVAFHHEETAQGVQEGFWANPKLGATAMGTKGAQNSSECALERLIIEINQRTQQEARHVRLVGSIFGGTGTALLPILFFQLRSQSRLVDLYALLPWFGAARGQDTEKRNANVYPALMAIYDRLERQKNAPLGQLRATYFSREGFQNVVPPAPNADKADDPWLRRVAQTIFSIQPNVVFPQANQNSCFASGILITNATNVPTSATILAPDTAANAKVLAKREFENYFGFLSSVTSAANPLEPILEDLVEVIKKRPTQYSRKIPDRDLVNLVRGALKTAAGQLGGAEHSAHDPAVVASKLRDAPRLKEAERVSIEQFLNSNSTAEDQAKLLAGIIIDRLQTSVNNGQFAYVHDQWEQHIEQLSESYPVNHLFSSSVPDPLGAGILIKQLEIGLDLQAQYWAALMTHIAWFAPFATPDAVLDARAKLIGVRLGETVFHPDAIHSKEFLVGYSCKHVGVVPMVSLLDTPNAAPPWPAINLDQGLRPVVGHLQATFLGTVQKAALSLPPHVLGRFVTDNVRLPLFVTEQQMKFLQRVRVSTDKRITENNDTVFFKGEPLVDRGSTRPLVNPSAGDNRGKVIWRLHVANLPPNDIALETAQLGNPRWI